ncbi:SDR family oxidoreductase [Micromonospora sp. KC721]|uniref:SDR family oxidoreductase n=1 Tax=Micromonospora sp. KC721 TaxID=2530380 RepID=UPI001048169E|nr:SDR family oxidoreductase [Micromonospora sp. KC721]TDB79828.1 SDR family oxidoreductase [Micromonospora sp. KC721]
MARIPRTGLTGRMTEHPILVTGGTGKSGSRVVSQLNNKGVRVRVGSRSGEPPFDWTDRSTWDAALEGVERVYVIPFDGELLTRPFVQLCEEVGVKRVVLLSGRGVDVAGYAGENSAAGKTHIDGEDAVRTCRLEWTIVRPAWFAQNFSEGFFLDAVRSGELRLPAGDGAASFVDAEDIAAVAVAALTENGHAGRIYELSGPRAVTLAEAAATISQATGRTVRYVPMSPEDFVAELVAEGWPQADAEDYADAVSPIRRGMDSHISNGVQQALGRPPRDFSDFVRIAAAAGAWPS